MHMQRVLTRVNDNIRAVFGEDSRKDAIWSALSAELQQRQADRRVDGNMSCSPDSIKNSVTKPEKQHQAKTRLRVKAVDTVLLEWVCRGKQGEGVH
jgi:hypothetical protein